MDTTTSAPPIDPDEDLYQAAGVRPVVPPGTLPADAQATDGGGFLHNLGLGTRATAQGALSIPGLAIDLTNLQPPGTAAQKTAAALDALGLPRPQTPGEAITSSAVEGGSGALLMGPEGRALEAGASYLGPTLAPYAARVGHVLAASPVAGTVAGTAGGGTSGGLAAAGADPWAQWLGGTAVGALVGLVPGATAGFASAADRALLNDARTRFGIRIAPAQADPTGKWAFAATKDLPLSGGEAFLEGQRNDFNTATGRLFGAQVAADGKLTPQIFENGEIRLGNEYSRLAQSATGRPDAGLITDLADLEARASALGQDAQPIINRINNLRTIVQNNNGVLPGNAVSAEISSRSPAAIGARAGGTVAQPLWNDYRQLLRDYVGRNPNVDQTAWADANRQYRNMKVIEPTVNINGDVSPARLAGAATRNQTTPGFDQDLSRLGQIGQKYLKEPPQSGTAPRSQVYDLLKEGAKAGGMALGIGGAENFSPEAATGLAGLLVGGSLANRAMQFGARAPAPTISYPGFVLRNAAVTPTQPPVGQEQMNPYWRMLMGGSQQ